jgi:hypothetical protein
MKATALILLALSVGGCMESYVHSKACSPSDKDGYQNCTHYIEYQTVTKCSGSCNPEGK